MKALSKIIRISFKGSSKNPDVLNTGCQELNAKSIGGLKKAIRYLETHMNDADGIFTRAGSIEEISAIVDFIQNNTLSENYLNGISNIHSIPMAIKEFLATFSPLIPCNLYDHLLSPMADYNKLLDKARTADHGGLEAVMKFLWKLVYYPQYQIDPVFLSRNIGIFILRADKAELYALNSDKDAQAHTEAFIKLIDFFPPSEEDAQRYMPDKMQNAESNKEESDKLDSVSSSACPTASIQDRSVKVNFLNLQNKPTQASLRESLSRYGEISNIGFKEKLAVILFADPLAAIACSEDREGKCLGSDFKLKYLGDRDKVIATYQSAPPSPSVSTSVILSKPASSSLKTIITTNPQEISMQQMPSQSLSKPPDVHGIALLATREEEGSFQRLDKSMGGNNNVTMGLADISAISHNPEASRLSYVNRAEDRGGNVERIGSTDSDESERSEYSSNMQAMRALAQRNVTPKKTWQEDLLVREGEAKGVEEKGIEKTSSPTKDMWVDAQPLRSSNNSVANIKRIEDNKSIVLTSYLDDEGEKAEEVRGQGQEQEQGKQEEMKRGEKKMNTSRDGDVEWDVRSGSGSGKKRQIRKIQVGGSASLSPAAPKERAVSPSPEKIRGEAAEKEDSDVESKVSYLEEQRSPELSISEKAQRAAAVSTFSLSSDEEEEKEEMKKVKIEERDMPRRAVASTNTSNSIQPTSRVDLPVDQYSPGSSVPITSAYIPSPAKQLATTNENESVSHSNYHKEQRERVFEVEQYLAQSSSHLPPLQSTQLYLHASPNNFPSTMQISSLTEKLHILEAQNKHYQEDITLQQQQLHDQELLWQAQIIHLQMKNAYLQQQQYQHTQEIQTLKLDLSSKTASIASLETQHRTMRESVRQAEQRAQRESLGVVLSQQKLIKTLESHIAELKSQNNQHNREIEELQEQYTEAVKQCLLYKGLALQRGQAKIVAHSRADVGTELRGESEDKGDGIPEVEKEGEGEEGYDRNTLFMDNEALDVDTMRNITNQEVQQYLVQNNYIEEEKKVWEVVSADRNSHIKSHPSTLPLPNTFAKTATQSHVTRSRISYSYNPIPVSASEEITHPAYPPNPPAVSSFTSSSSRVQPENSHPQKKYSEEVLERHHASSSHPFRLTSSLDYRSALGGSTLRYEKEREREKVDMDTMRKYFAEVREKSEGTGRVSYEDLRRDHVENMSQMRSLYLGSHNNSGASDSIGNKIQQLKNANKY